MEGEFLKGGREPFGLKNFLERYSARRLQGSLGVSVVFHNFAGQKKRVFGGTPGLCPPKGGYKVRDINAEKVFFAAHHSFSRRSCYTGGVFLQA